MLSSSLVIRRLRGRLSGAIPQPAGSSFSPNLKMAQKETDYGNRITK